MYDVHYHVHKNLVFLAVLSHMNPVHPPSPNLVSLILFLSSLPQMKLHMRFISVHATCSTHFTIYDLIVHILPEKPAVNRGFSLS